MKSLLLNILDRGSTIFQIDLRYLVSGSFWLTASQFTSIISGFILSVVFANYVAKDTFGQYSYIFSFISFFGVLAYIGMDRSVTRAVAQKREGMLIAATQKTLPWALFASLPLLILGIFYTLPSSRNTSLSLSFLISFIAVIPYWSFRFFEYYYLGKELYREYFFLRIFLNILPVPVILITALLSKSVFLIVFASLAINTLLRIVLSIRTYSIANDTKPIKEDFALAKGLNGIFIIMNFLAYGDKIFLAKILGFESVAIYTFAQVFPDQIKGFLKHFYVLSLPKFSQTKSIEPKYFYVKLIQFSLFALGFIVIFNIIVKPVFVIFYPQYIDAVLPARILSLSLIAVPELIITAFFESKSLTRFLALKAYPSQVLQLVLLLSLTLHFQIVGAAIAVTVSRIFSVSIGIALTYYYFRNNHSKQ